MSSRGKVYFVGAGTGAIDLLTLRAMRVLERAEVVLHDDLVPAGFTDLVSETALVIRAGKRCGARGISQQEVNALMVEHARAGKLVARLKCGDPSIFGRLGEEVEALRAAQVEFEIVPGVTAALAAAAAAQIALTDRRLASRVTFAAAALAGGKRQDWPRITAPDTTLVIYMPGPDYRRLGAELLASGTDPEMPCVAIARAGAADETAVFGTVAGLKEACSMPSPAVVIVGEVVRARIREALLGLAATSTAEGNSGSIAGR